MQVTKLTALDDSISARTNIFDIAGDCLKNIESLLFADTGDLFVTYHSKKFRKDSSESQEDFWKKVHRELKELIRNKLKLPKEASVQYQTAHHWADGSYTIYFFYLSPEPNESSVLLKHLSSEPIGLRKIFEALVALHLKLAFIRKYAESYDLEPALYNSELYLSVQLQNKRKGEVHQKLDTLYPDIYFSDHNELILSIHKKTFSASLVEGTRAVIDETELLFHSRKHQQNPYTYSVNQELNATKDSKKKFMSFNDYHNSINHAQNLLLDTLKAIFNEHAVPYSERVFKANYALDDFLSSEKSYQKPVVVIDNLGESFPEQTRPLLYQRLAQEFDSPEIIMAKDYPEICHFKEGINYLVLNQSSKKNGSSVSISGKALNTFWDAYSLHLKGKGQDLDYYSRLKIGRFESNLPIVIQGWNSRNTDKLTKELKAGDKMHKPQLPFQFERIKTELWLKEGVFSHKELSIELDDSKLTLIYIRKPSNKKFGKGNFYASVTNVTITDHKLFINESQILKSESRLLLACPYLKHRPSLHNNSFFIFDRNEQVLLSSYNSARIPKIVGNAKLDNIAAAERAQNQLSRQATTPADIVLPYYIARKKQRHIYLQKCENDLLCFVTTLGNVNQNIEKQNLIYNILTFDENGNILDALDQKVTDLYLKSFTKDVLKINEYSKSSLLEKVARIYIEN